MSAEAIERRREVLQALLTEQLAGGASGLEDYLAANSRLPGPAADLTLVGQAAEVLAEAVAQENDAVWDLLASWSALPLDVAGVNTPGEILPAIAAVAHGEAAVRAPRRWDASLARLREQASDPRWRTRECVAMGLQRMLRTRPGETGAALAAWVEQGNWLERRGALAGLAEPDLMQDADLARLALRLHEQAIERLVAADSAERKSVEFLAFRKGIGYTFSVVAAGRSDEALARLGAWVQMAMSSGDRDLRWVLRENLKKNRLSRRYPAETGALLATLDTGH